MASRSALHWRGCLGPITLLVLLSSCSFHSTQLSYLQGVLKELGTEKAVVSYWMLRLPGESLRAIPIIKSDRLFFSDGERYLVSVGAESIEEIKALDAGTVQKLAVTKANEAEKLVSGALPACEPCQTLSINEPIEDGLAFDGGLIVYSKTRLPDAIYFCSSWVYRSDKRSSHKLCESKQDGKLKFTHELDDRGVVKRFNVMLDDQLLIDLERTMELFSL